MPGSVDKIPRIIFDMKSHRPRVCELCGNVFVPKTTRSKFCSRRCSLRSAERKYEAKPSVKLAKKIRDRERWKNRDAGMVALMEFNRIAKEERMRVDCEYYARVRAARREVRRRQNDKHRRIPYKPLPQRRIPDWATKGMDVLCDSSEFLSVNLTKSQKAFTRELYRERKKSNYDNNRL